MQFPRYRTIKRVYAAILMAVLLWLYANNVKYGLLAAATILLAVIVGGVISFKADDQDGLL